MLVLTCPHSWWTPVLGHPPPRDGRAASHAWAQPCPPRSVTTPRPSLQPVAPGPGPPPPQVSPGPGSTYQQAGINPRPTCLIATPVPGPACQWADTSSGTPLGLLASCLGTRTCLLAVQEPLQETGPGNQLGQGPFLPTSMLTGVVATTQGPVRPTSLDHRAPMTRGECVTGPPRASLT